MEQPQTNIPQHTHTHTHTHTHIHTHTHTHTPDNNYIVLLVEQHYM